MDDSKTTDVGCAPLSGGSGPAKEARFVSTKTQKTMIAAASMKVTNKEVGNVAVSGRMKQIFVMIIAILIGMIISVTTADAKDFQRESHKRNKAMYKKQTVVMAHACNLLKEKRSITANKAVKDNSKLKYR